MKVALALFALVIFCTGIKNLKAFFISGVEIDSKLDISWGTYQLRFSKKYGSTTEELVRRTLWENNVNRIATHNARFEAGRETYRMEENHLADWTQAELRTLLGAIKPKEVKSNKRRRRRQAAAETIISNRFQAPPAIDLRDSNCLTAVKDQGQCGSCWAFAAVTPMEYQTCKLTGKPAVTLSEQQLVDCSRPFGNIGCSGGWETLAWNYVLERGITTNCTYSYTGKDKACRSKRSQAVAVVTGITEIPSKDVSAMKAAVAAKGPITIAMQVLDSFLFYGSGIYSDDKCLGLDPSVANHAMVIVGYGTSKEGTPYWVIRNSWGPNWGSGGYVLFKAGVNLCNVESFAAFPDVKPVKPQTPVCT